MEKSRNEDKFLWLEHLFEAVFNLAYMLNITPFKIAFDDTKEMYYIKSSMTRKIYCLIPTLTTAMYEIISINSATSGVSVGDPSMIFRVATEAGDSFLCFMLWYVAWFRQEDIARYFSLLSLRRSEKWGKGYHSEEIFKKGKTKAYLACSISILFVCSSGVLQTVIQLANMMRMYSLDSDSLLGFIYSHTLTGLFIEPSHIIKTGEMNTSQLVMSCLAILSYLNFKALNAFSIFLCLGGVVVVAHSCWKFTNFLQEETNDLNFMRRLQYFKEEVESVNQIIGPIMFGVAIVAGPPFFVMNFSRMVTSWDIGTLLISMTCWLYTGILMGAAEVSYKTGEICEWILVYGEGDYEDELFGIYVELSQSPIGLRGLECFTVTYRYMSQMMTAVITFVIILLQFVSAPGSNAWILNV